MKIGESEFPAKQKNVILILENPILNILNKHGPTISNKSPNSSDVDQSISGSVLLHMDLALTRSCPPSSLVPPKFPRVPQEGGLAQGWESVC